MAGAKWTGKPAKSSKRKMDEAMGEHRHVRVQIHWQRRPIQGTSYSTVARFDDISDKWPEEAWSVVLNFVEVPVQDAVVEADMRLLVEAGPQELLYVGSGFELYEGPKLVATGHVVND